MAETKTAAPFLIKYATGADDGAHLEYLGTTRRIRDQDEQPGYGELHLVAYLELLLDTDYRLTEGWWFAGDLASGHGRSVLSTHPDATSGDEFLDLVVELLMLIRGLPNLACTREDAKSETDWHKKFRAKNVNAQYPGSLAGCLDLDGHEAILDALKVLLSLDHDAALKLTQNSELSPVVLTQDSVALLFEHALHASLHLDLSLIHI